MAIDWYPNGDCYCQDDCACMLDVGGDATTITRDSAVDALPSEVCSGGDKRMLTAGAPSFEEFRKSHKERTSHK